MQRIIIGLLINILFLTACGQTTIVTPTALVHPVEQATSTPAPTATRTSLPSATPTASITPLPTIPTFTPTFDVSTIVTVTPAPKAECPTSIPYPEKDFDLFKFRENGNYKSPEEAVLAVLNKYGPEILVKYGRRYGTDLESIAFQDFTNDGVPEVAIRLTLNISSTPFDIFGCKNGVYQLFLSIPSNGLGYAPIIFAIEDNNKNGIPELTILEGYLSQGGHFFVVYEWNGEKFTSILSPFYENDPDSTYLWVEATGEIHYEDIDNDSINELILDSGVPVWETYWAGLPWRNKRTYYKWNGQHYAPYSIEFAQPEFWFQAVQDGDLATSQQEYDKALRLYQEAIFSDKLKGYSPEIRDNLRAQWDASYGTDPTPTPYPISLDEYPKLAAYAYYRILLLHLVQGQDTEASTTYNTLQQKFGDDPYGHPYVDMATAFWEAYQSSHKMYDGCAAAIQYAAEHPEILTPLGSDYHGSQARIYKPEDVCPFR
ncbi:MAG: hypothetical protein AB1509_04090 [Chloroflexota bacterium]